MGYYLTSHKSRRPRKTFLVTSFLGLSLPRDSPEMGDILVNDGNRDGDPERPDGPPPLMARRTAVASVRIVGRTTMATAPQLPTRHSTSPAIRSSGSMPHHASILRRTTAPYTQDQGCPDPTPVPGKSRSATAMVPRNQRALLTPD